MPSTSKKQHNFMAAVANNPAFAKKVGVPQSVGKEFNKADEGRKFSQGGHMPMKPGMRGFQTLQPRHMQTTAGPTRPAMPPKRMKEGGMAHEDVKMDKKMMQKAVNKHEGRLHKGASMTKLSAGGYTRAADGVATKGKTKGTMVKMKSGGSC